MGAMFGDLEGLRHIEDLPTDGFCVTIIIRQRRAAALAGARIMIDDVVRAFGLLRSGSLVARLAAAGPVGLAARLRVRFFRGPLFFFRSSLAGGLELSSAALECDNPFAQVDILALQRVDLLDQRRAQAQQPLTPFP